jgi:hypothetical protein
VLLRPPQFGGANHASDHDEGPNSHNDSLLSREMLVDMGRDLDTLS